MEQYHNMSVTLIKSNSVIYRIWLIAFENLIARPIESRWDGIKEIYVPTALI